MMALSKGEQTRVTILDEALKIASKLGLEGLTIGSLADATGMSKSGL
ncbi:MAG TPA: TetR/AcrR family transcriptional regulator, partial [Burkholderiales bacterium]|nr:TetR/AcrR family transcriptional regulator [Burkholderiales bacterium]